VSGDGKETRLGWHQHLVARSGARSERLGPVVAAVGDGGRHRLLFGVGRFY